MNVTLRRSVAAAAVLAISAGTAGCSEDVTNTAADRAALADPFEREEDVAVDGLVGLEVTIVGNVDEVLSDEALRVGRDGLGSSEDTQQEGAGLDYDYDYYDNEDLVEYDEEFEDDDAVDVGVLVVDGTGLPSVEEGEAVRVSGTVRRLDPDRIEALYDIDLADEVLGDDEGAPVIVADTITEADAIGQAPGAGTANPSPGDGD